MALPPYSRSFACGKLRTIAFRNNPGARQYVQAGETLSREIWRIGGPRLVQWTPGASRYQVDNSVLRSYSIPQSVDALKFAYLLMRTFAKEAGCIRAICVPDEVKGNGERQVQGGDSPFPIATAYALLPRRGRARSMATPAASACREDGEMA
ncbi:hypothetical protein AcW1_001303 [Taiwanofungus camphoratus]|nr:hypothetical protein AcW2_000173 [Antrodia cinnamomea]KAI0962488.1 hypothetical protein AcV7_001324 [Antrodia cinnamomea]KAI0964494.1 hypothetical protein AcW1_001303 [Antrodia cinnamomea]